MISSVVAASRQCQLLSPQAVSDGKSKLQCLTMFPSGDTGGLDKRILRDEDQFVLLSVPIRKAA